VQAAYLSFTCSLLLATFSTASLLLHTASPDLWPGRERHTLQQQQQPSQMMPISPTTTLCAVSHFVATQPCTSLQHNIQPYHQRCVKTEDMLPYNLMNGNTVQLCRHCCFRSIHTHVSPAPPPAGSPLETGSIHRLWLLEGWRAALQPGGVSAVQLPVLSPITQYDLGTSRSAMMTSADTPYSVAKSVN